MAQSFENDTDDTSTQPVSSLRSLFEGKSAQVADRHTVSKARSALGTNCGRRCQTPQFSLDPSREPSRLSDLSGRTIISHDASRLGLESQPSSPKPYAKSVASAPVSPPLPSTGIGSSTFNATSYMQRLEHTSPGVKPHKWEERSSVSAVLPKAPPVPPPRTQICHSVSKKKEPQLFHVSNVNASANIGRLSNGLSIGDSATEQRLFIPRSNTPWIPPKRDSGAHTASLAPPPKTSDETSPFHTPPSSDDADDDYDIRNGSDITAVQATQKAYTKTPKRSSFQQSHVQSAAGSMLAKESDTQPANAMKGHPGKSSGSRKITSDQCRVQSRCLDDRDIEASIPPRLPPRNLPLKDPPALATRTPGSSNVDFASVAHLIDQDMTSSTSKLGGKHGLSSPSMRDSVPSSSITDASTSSASSLKYPSSRSLELSFKMDARPALERPFNGPIVIESIDTTNINRRPPHYGGARNTIETDQDSRLIDICGNYVSIAGNSTKVWEMTSSKLILNLLHAEKDNRITALAFKSGQDTASHKPFLWLGTTCGHIYEVSIAEHCITASNCGPHDTRSITKIYRHPNKMWTLDDGGRLCVWSGGRTKSPDLQEPPSLYNLPRGQSVSIIVHQILWYATGKSIRLYHPNAHDGSPLLLRQDPLHQSNIGAITTATTIDDQHDRVYFGHTDGKVSVYSTDTYVCLQIVSISIYRVVCLTGIGPNLWAGYNTGMLYVYDTRKCPWLVKKEWHAHQDSPVHNLAVDSSGLWRSGQLCVASIGSDRLVKLWDGTLEKDCLDGFMQEHDSDYCTFRELSASVTTWNAGASTPNHFRDDDDSQVFFKAILEESAIPDLLVFGFQELVDLDDKKLTALSLLRGNRKKDPAEPEHVGRQYRAWRDFLVQCVQRYAPPDVPYHLLATSNMVGLFSCVFIKSALRGCIGSVDLAEIKRGIGGFHGNKGALIVRFTFDDTSICLVNCHLAAGQSQTSHRNNDAATILEAIALPVRGNESEQRSSYICGGDGSMILDNEICILNGDLNYRIDAMSRDAIVKAANGGNYAKLMERDQLLVSRRRNPNFRLLAFEESTIAFPPTYKYDLGSDRYDTSDKRRAPAWCDRILYRGTGKIKQINYRRHELKVSDHRPVSAMFKMRVKRILAENHHNVSEESLQFFLQAMKRLSEDARIASRNQSWY